MKHMRYLTAALSILGLGSTAFSQAQQQTNLQRFERQLEQIQRDTRQRVDSSIPAEQRALLDYGGYITLNFLAIDDIQQTTHILRQYDLVGYGRVNIDNVHEVFVRARTSYRDFNSGDSFDGEGDEDLPPTIEQAYYRFDLNRYLTAYKGKESQVNNFIFQGGRQFVYWSNGLVLGDTLDGVLASFIVDRFQLDLLAGATANGIVDFDSSRPDFDQETARNFYGGILSAQLGKHRPFVYFLTQEDKNEDEVLVTDVSGLGGSGEVTTRFNYDSYYIGIGSNGSIGDRLVYGLEAVYEGGEGLSNTFEQGLGDLTPQTEEDIEAWALDFRLDYLLADPRRTRLSFETILASGDEDREQTTTTFRGNRPGTDDEAFNAFGLLNTGLAFAPAVSNLVSVRFGASAFPLPEHSLFRRMQVGADVLFFGKMETDGGFDEPTRDTFFLGFEPDIYLNWQITSDVTLAVRYGVFFPGPAIGDSTDAGAGSDDHPRHFFFTGITIAF